MQFFRHERGIRALSRAASRGPVSARPAGPVVLMRLASQDGGPVTSTDKDFQSGRLPVRATTGGRVIPVPPGQTDRICPPHLISPADPVLHTYAS